MASLVIDEKLFKRIATIVLVSVLIILTFLILKPIIISAIFGLILAFIFYPIHRRFSSKIKNKTLSALLISLALIIIIILPLLLLTPILVKQTFEVYSFLQKQNIFDALQKNFPGIFSNPELSKNIVISINSFISNLTSSFLSNFKDILLNSPTIILNFVLALFVFFFGLRDGDKLVCYLQDLSPLSKESEEKIFKQFKDITYAVIFGQIIVGIAQGLIAGVGLFIFKVPNALVLTLLATFFGIFPVLGAWLVWVPADIYLFLIGKTGAAFGLLIYGLVIVSWIDNVLRVYIVSKKTKISSGVILVSMIGGLLVFGILGLILGPLIISYLLLFLEFYRNKKSPGLIETSPKPDQT